MQPPEDHRLVEFDQDGKLVAGYDLDDANAPAGVVVVSFNVWSDFVRNGTTLRRVSGSGNSVVTKTITRSTPAPEDRGEARFSQDGDLATIVEVLVELLGKSRREVLDAVRVAAKRVADR